MNIKTVKDKKIDFRIKKLIVFDLDGTLTPSKAAIRPDMAKVLAKLLEKKTAAVIGGGRYEQFKEQFVAKLKLPAKLLTKLFIFPVSSTAFYRYRRGEWKKVYAKNFSSAQKKKIMGAFNAAFKELGYKRPAKIYGEAIEDRGSQITFSAVGQDVVKILGVRRGVKIKEEWNKKMDVRPKIVKALQKRLPNLNVSMGGLTSIDITRAGIDKAYGIKQIAKTLKTSIKEMLFVGDALYPGGNDHAALKTGVDCVAVNGPENTMEIIESILKSKIKK